MVSIYKYCHTHKHWFSMKRSSRVNLCKYRLRAKVIVPFNVCYMNFVLLCIRISNRMVFLLNFTWKWNGSSYFQCETNCVYLLHTHTRIEYQAFYEEIFLSYFSSMETRMNILYQAIDRMKNLTEFFFAFNRIPIFTSTRKKYNKFSKYFNFTKHSHPWYIPNPWQQQRSYKKQFLGIHIREYVFCVDYSVQIAIKTDNEHIFTPKCSTI